MFIVENAQPIAIELLSERVLTAQQRIKDGGDKTKLESIFVNYCLWLRKQLIEKGCNDKAIV